MSHRIANLLAAEAVTAAHEHHENGRHLVKLVKGGNAQISASTVTAVLRWGAGREVDPQALLLGPSGRIRSDDDFVFFNAPEHPSGTVRLVDSGAGSATVHLALATVEPGVDRIVLTGSVEAGTFQEIPDLVLTVREDTGAPITVELSQPEPVSAIVFGEFYRRAGGWKFRNVGQGWNSGLRGLAEEFGVTVDDERPTAAEPPASPAPASPAREPGWYPDESAAGTLRWWSGAAWSADTRPSVAPGRGLCTRCGRPVRAQAFGRVSPCRWCENDVSAFLRTWHDRAWQVLITTGPTGPAWDELWVSLRFQQIADSTAREALRPLAMAYVERLVAFAFADGEIDEPEIETFEATVRVLERAADLAPAAAHLGQLRERMRRGRSLTRVRSGDLPRIQSSSLHLEADEILYLEADARQVKYLASGPRVTPGRLIGSSKKLRFVGNGAGMELPWAKVVSVTSEYGNVVVAATTARGGGTFAVSDAEYAAAVLEGALRVAKRLVLAPGQRDTRSIPQHIKTEVWQRDGGKCCQCGDRNYLEFDHIIPFSQGGATSAANLQILCRRCNLAKGARI